MKVVRVRRFGGPDALELLEIPDPAAGPGAIRIRVRAAAVNPVDTLIRSGQSPVRPRGAYPAIPGLDVAGVVDEIGSAVDSDLRVGDRVMAMVNPTRAAGGGYAERLVLPAHQVVRSPRRCSDVEAATFMMNGLTALRALEVADLPPAGTVAVTGAAGAVGGFTVQLAVWLGHRVIADAAPADRDLVRSLGAHAMVGRGPGVGRRILEHAADGVDAVVDAAVIGADVVDGVRRGGVIVGVREAKDVRELHRAAGARNVRVLTAFVHDYDDAVDKLALVASLAAGGHLTARVADVYPAQDAASAHRRLESGGVRGRLVLAF